MARTFPAQDIPPLPRVRQRWTWMWIAFAVIAVLLTIVGFWWAGRSRGPVEDVRGDAFRGSPAETVAGERLSAA